MINFTWIYTGVMFLMLVIILALVYVDFKKKRVLTKRVPVSFMIPCYNDSVTVGKTINSIYSSYDKDKIELIVGNDKSTDDSLEILKKLQKKYGFKIINNKENMGKSKTLNNISKFAKHDILWVVDADIILTKEAIEDVLARFEYDSNVAGVSCPYSYQYSTFFDKMQSMECNLMSLLQISQNIHTCFSLWGGCLAVRKSAFEKIGRFSENMITEDIELSFKLAEHKFKVEQSTRHVMTFPMDNFFSWYKQKSRWCAGAVQCYLKHWKVWTRHPLQVFFLTIFAVLNFFAVFYLFKEVIFLNGVWNSWELIRSTSTLLLSFKIMGIYYGLEILRDLSTRILFSAFSMPYTYSFVKSPRNILRILYALPFSIIYLPAFTIVFILGIPKGIKAYFTVKEGQRSW